MSFPEVRIFVDAGLSAGGPGCAVAQVVVGGDPEDAEDGEADGGLAPPAPAELVVDGPLGQAVEAVGQGAREETQYVCNILTHLEETL